MDKLFSDQMIEKYTKGLSTDLTTLLSSFTSEMNSINNEYTETILRMLKVVEYMLTQLLDHSSLKTNKGINTIMHDIDVIQFMLDDDCITRLKRMSKFPLIDKIVFEYHNSVFEWWCDRTKNEPNHDKVIQRMKNVGWRIQ